MQTAATRSYLLTILTVILAFNYVDRLAVGILLQAIKIDLSLSDTQLGLLTGIAFALFYSVLGIPIARWADRGNRVAIISLTAALWSVAVAMCGLATSFVQLLIIRIGVAVGEAGCMPPAQSLIADYFTRSERPRALARYMLGGPLALTIGYFVAGWLNELYGWRATFIIVGLPGLALAAVAWLTLKEPRRETTQAASSRDAGPASISTLGDPDPTVKEVCTTLWANAAFRHLLFGFSVYFFFGYGVIQWQPAFFIRSHGMQTTELGLWFALIFGVVGGAGTYLGGELADRYAKGNERLQLQTSAAIFALLVVAKVAAYLAPHYQWALLFITVAALGNALTQGPLYAAIQTLVPARMRATAIAVVYLFANLIGMGFGPLAAGALSDALQPRFGGDSLRYALVILSPGYFWAAWHIWRASQTVANDIAAAQTDISQGRPAQLANGLVAKY